MKRVTGTRKETVAAICQRPIVRKWRAALPALINRLIAAFERWRLGQAEEAGRTLRESHSVQSLDQDDYIRSNMCCDKEQS
jgi:hypothetical protein